MGWRLSKKFHFEAAHHLPHLPEGHKCARPHGHSYTVEVILKSDILDYRGFAGMDYGDLDPLRVHIDARFDHQDLNEIEEMEGLYTTAENLAKYFFDWCKARWPTRIEAVRVYETAKTYAEYRSD